MADPIPTKIDQAILIIRKNPNITLAEFMKELSLTSRSVARSLMDAAQRKEIDLAARLGTENVAAEIHAAAQDETVEFFVTDRLGHAHAIELVKEGRRRVVFKLVNEQAEITISQE